MGFEGVYTAVYDYTPQGENELAFAEGDLLYILDKSSDDGWWKAKKKTAEFESEEPVGLIPHNYVEEVSSPFPLLFSVCRLRWIRLLVGKSPDS